MSLHIERAECKILDNKDLTVLQYKTIKMIRKILRQYHSCQQGRMQKFFEGVQKCSFGIFSLCECRRHDYFREVGGMTPRKF